MGHRSNVINFEQADVLWLRRLANLEGFVMTCASCGSGNQSQFTAELNVHFRGLKNLDNPGVLLFPKLLICLDCGFSRFTASTTNWFSLQKVP
jgi:hypothetical protein